MADLVAKVVVELDPASVTSLKNGVTSAVNSAFSNLNGSPAQQMGAKLLKSLNDAAAAAAKAQAAIAKAMQAGANVGSPTAINNITAAIEASAKAAQQVAQYFSGAYAQALKQVDTQAVGAAIALEKLAEAQAKAALAQQKLQQAQSGSAQQPASAQTQTTQFGQAQQAAAKKAAQDIQKAFESGFTVGKSPVSGLGDLFLKGIKDSAATIKTPLDALKAGGDGISAVFSGVAGKAGTIGLALGASVLAVTTLVDLGKQFAEALANAYKHGREIALDQARLTRILGASAREATVLQGMLAATGNAGNVFSTITLNQIQARLAELQLVSQGAIKPTEKSKVFAQGLAELGISPSAIGTEIKSITDVITAVVGQFDRMDDALKRSLLFEQLGGLFGQDFANVVGLGKEFVTDLVAISSISDQAAKANKLAADAVLKSATLRERAEAELAGVIFRAGAPIQVAVDNFARNINLGASTLFQNFLNGAAQMLGQTIPGAKGASLNQFGNDFFGGALGFLKSVPGATGTAALFERLNNEGQAEFNRRVEETRKNLSFAAGGGQTAATGVVPIDIFRKGLGASTKKTISPTDQLKDALAEAKIITDAFVKEGLAGVDNAVMQGIGTMSVEEIAKRLEAVRGNASLAGSGALKEAAAALKREFELSAAVGNLENTQAQIEGLEDAQKSLTKATEDYNKSLEKRNAAVAAGFSKEFDSVQSATSAYETLFDRIAKAEIQQRKAEKGQTGVVFAGNRSASQVARDLQRLQRGEAILAAEGAGDKKTPAQTTQLRRQFRGEDLAALRKSLGFAVGEKVTLEAVQQTARTGLTPQQKTALERALEQQRDIRQTVAQRIQNALQTGAFAGLQFNPDRINDETGKATEAIASSIIKAVDGVDLGNVDAEVARKFSLGETILKSLAFQAASLPGEAGEAARAMLSDTANALTDAIIGFGDLGTELKLNPKIKITPKLLIDTGAFAEGFFSESDRDETAKALRQQANKILDNQKLTPDQQFAQLSALRLKSLGLDTSAGASGIVGGLAKQLASDAEREFGLAKTNLEDQIKNLADTIKKDVKVDLDVKMDSSSANAAADAARLAIDAKIMSLNGAVTEITRVINVKFQVNGQLPPGLDQWANGIPNTPPPPPPKLPADATGGPVYGQRPYWVGERGPEMFIPTENGRILTVGQSIEFARQQAVVAMGAQRQQVRQIVPANISNTTTTYSPTISVDARGAGSPVAVEKRVKRAVRFISDMPEFKRGRHAI